MFIVPKAAPGQHYESCNTAVKTVPCWCSFSTTTHKSEPLSLEELILLLVLLVCTYAKHAACKPSCQHTKIIPSCCKCGHALFNYRLVLSYAKPAPAPISASSRSAACTIVEVNCCQRLRASVAKPSGGANRHAPRPAPTAATRGARYARYANPAPATSWNLGALRS